MFTARLLLSKAGGRLIHAVLSRAKQHSADLLSRNRSAIVFMAAVYAQCASRSTVVCLFSGMRFLCVVEMLYEKYTTIFIVICGLVTDAIKKLFPHKCFLDSKW